MLTKDLLVAQRYRGKITPRYVDPSSAKNLETAERVLQAFHEHLGQRRGELHQALEALESHKSFKLVRGLAQLLERRSLFEAVTPQGVEPVALRRRLFQRGYVTAPEEREARIQETAVELGVSPQEIEAAFWADRDEHHLLRGFLAPGPRATDDDQEPRLISDLDLQIPPEELLKQYNLSLTQTLLFDALDLWFQASGNFQQIFRWIKYLGLMYEAVEELPGQVSVKVDGPASLFKETTKYGTALAKLLPALTRAREWTLEARIKDGKPYTFELDHRKRALFPSRTDVPEETFDSAVEENFYRRIRALMPEWQVKREPTIMRAGKHIFIPDFGFFQERRGLRYYLEIVGFWTPQYLEKKLAKLKATEAELLVAVDRHLNCTQDELKATGKEVFTYEKRLPLEPVIGKLMQLAEARTAEELERLGDLSISIEPEEEGDRIPLEALAQKYEVGIEAIREAVKDRLERGRLAGYRLLRDELVSDELLAQLKRELDALPERDSGRDLSEVQRVLDDYGVGQQSLEPVGYRVEWASLLEPRVVRLDR